MGKNDERNEYAVIIRCSNCSHPRDIRITIPKGLTVEVWLRGYECPDCGCKTMDRVYKDK